MVRFTALIPIVIAAVWTTGQQFSLSASLLKALPEDDWRTSLIERFGFSVADTGIGDSLVAGLLLVGTTLITAIFAAGITERIASGASGRKFDISVLYFALLFAFVMPPTASTFQLFFGISLGVLLGHSILGGDGKTFLNPALVGAALTQVSFPMSGTDDPVWPHINGYSGTRLFQQFGEEGSNSLVWLDITWWDAFVGNTQGFLGTTSTLAILFGGVILLLGRTISWQLVLAHFLGAVVIASLLGMAEPGMMTIPWHFHLLLGSFAFGVIFLAADPSSSCCTKGGRWIQGLMAGGLIVLMRAMNPAHPDSVIAVLLLMSMLAPLIDHLVVWRNIRRRMHRNSNASGGIGRG